MPGEELKAHVKVLVRDAGYWTGRAEQARDIGAMMLKLTGNEQAAGLMTTVSESYFQMARLVRSGKFDVSGNLDGGDQRRA